MLLRSSHPVVHPYPAAPAPAGLGQGPVAAAPAALGQGPVVAAPAAVAQGPVAPAPAAVAQAQAAAAAAQAQGQGPVPAPAPAVAAEEGDGNAPPPGVQMVDPRGAPRTRWGLGARLAQALLGAAAVAFMASTDDFHEVTAFRLLVAAESLQCLWSLALAAVDVYALLIKRSFRTPRVTTIYSTGDWVTGGLGFAAASGSAAITILIDDDLLLCSENHCPTYMAATAMAFLSWFAIAPCCLINLWTAVYRVQRA
ncbi:CASP-like protein 5A3 [Hordeum vulgare]|nr:CASP-like protein 5A3 [Hordeum vulgare]